MAWSPPGKRPWWHYQRIELPTPITHRLSKPHRKLYWLSCIVFCLLALYYSSSYFEIHVTPHPVELLVQQSRKEFYEKVQRQSRTLEKAETEYKRRYGRSPPQGFATWFNFTTTHNVHRIDEYDEMAQSLKPFRDAGPETLRKYIQQVKGGPHISVLSIRDHKLITPTGWWVPTYEEAIHAMVDPILEFLPDMDLPLNTQDEARVLISSRDGEKDEEVRFETRDHENVWWEVSQPCIGINTTISKDSERFKPYIVDVSESKDICQHPELGGLVGFVTCPESMSITPQAVPLFSQAKLGTFGDLLFPSPGHIEHLLKSHYDPSKDVAWQDKTNDLFWVGSTTGGHSENGSWHNFQRHRLVALTNSLPHPSYPASLAAAFARHLELYDIHFTAALQCSEQECDVLRKYFGVKGGQPFEEMFRHRFIFDVDGNSFSGRFFSLLLSKSLVLKQSVQKEFWEEWLGEWVHYVPVSVRLEELPELMEFMALDKRGQRLAREIAEEGAEWASGNVRVEDAMSYLFRLLLEYAELFR